jgi:hypothetical protein
MTMKGNRAISDFSQVPEIDRGEVLRSRLADSPAGLGHLVTGRAGILGYVLKSPDGTEMILSGSKPIGFPQRVY